MFDRAVAELGDRPLLFVRESPIGAASLASLVDGCAAALRALGVRAGDRVALYMQNDPQFVIALLATWRIGAIAVPCNPMLRARELEHHLRDAGAKVLVALDALYAEVVDAVAAVVESVVTTRPDDLSGGADTTRATPAGAYDLLRLVDDHRRDAPPAEAVRPGADDVAVLTYTSGTTGPPKGAMNTHGNIAYASRIYRDCLGVGPTDTVLGLAPLFHVTGLTGHIGLALAAGAPVVLAHRFDAAVAAELTEHHRATVTVAAITAYIALADAVAARPRDLSSLRRAYSGGAPIAPAVVDDLRRRTGLLIRPVYGLTETSGPTHLALPDEPAPVDPATGALTVGKAAPGTAVRVLDEAGRPLGPGEVGEVAVRGPQVIPGYWNRPEETQHALPGGELRTGDIGVLDADGWLYLVDRRKDMIIASGFKIWPREVEDVLYEHPAVREAAVVGVADEYRGERACAFVSLKAGATVAPPELIDHCRRRLAAYKYPREVHIVDELPKTASGKILRRALRARVASPAGAERA
jgi:long-chain acyl-CoA synthetase